MKKDETYISSTVNYIKKNLEKGYNKDSLKWALISQGTSRSEVDKAFIQAEKEIANETAMRVQKLNSASLPPKIEPIIDDKPKKGFFAKLFGD